MLYLKAKGVKFSQPNLRDHGKKFRLPLWTPTSGNSPTISLNQSQKGRSKLYVHLFLGAVQITHYFQNREIRDAYQKIKAVAKHVSENVPLITRGEIMLNGENSEIMITRKLLACLV